MRAALEVVERHSVMMVVFLPHAIRRPAAELSHTSMVEAQRKAQAALGDWSGVDKGKVLLLGYERDAVEEDRAVDVHRDPVWGLHFDATTWVNDPQRCVAVVHSRPRTDPTP
jgi:hypothetical protein